ncbi:Atg14 domain-containing protein [Candidatus Parcubacteria bacterium]|nr:hypothetical protein [Candidatus Omnitrophota bacterium]MCG2689357.1 Atg14 domain-containing protein [Candidatus Parcubacteria bacterium]
MKKDILILLFLGVLLFPSSALAQEQIRAYSGFERFIDNAKMLFSFGDKKVVLALDIREKELNSAIANTKNGNSEGAELNLERAKKRLQYVQNKVSKNIADDVKTNIDETINRINEEEDLPDNFETYILEEEKTQLTAELVDKVTGKEEQNLTREIIKDSKSGESRVEITVGGNEVRTEVREIKMRIDTIDKVIEAGKNTIDTFPKHKDNEDVSPPTQYFDNKVDDIFLGPGMAEPGTVDKD